MYGTKPIALEKLIYTYLPSETLSVPQSILQLRMGQISVIHCVPCHKPSKGELVHLSLAKITILCFPYLNKQHIHVTYS